jgi:hypothetical protein
MSLCSINGAPWHLRSASNMPLKVLLDNKKLETALLPCQAIVRSLSRNSLPLYMK